MTPTRVLLVARWPIGGIRTFFRYVFGHFESSKYRFTLFAPDLPETRLLLEDLAHLKPDYIAAPADLGQSDMLRRVTAVLWRGQFDLVHSHGFTANVSAALGACLTRVPHLVTLHETLDASRFVGPMGKASRAVLQAALSMTDRIHCVSQDSRANLLEYLPSIPGLARKIVVIPNGVRPAQFLEAPIRDLRAELRLAAGTGLIGYFGRYMPEKGFRYLLEALQQVVQHRSTSAPTPVLLSFGPEDAFYREERERVKAMGLGPSVRFMPFLPDIASTLKGLDVVVMPSLREAAGLVAMEALVAGVPVIGTDCVGLRETLAGTPARVVPAGSSAALAAAMAAELDDSTEVCANEFATVAAARFDAGRRAVELQRLMDACVARRVTHD